MPIIWDRQTRAVELDEVKMRESRDLMENIVDLDHETILYVQICRFTIGINFRKILRIRDCLRIKLYIEDKKVKRRQRKYRKSVRERENERER